MKLTKSQTTVRILLGLFLLLAVISYLFFLLTSFSAQVPDWLPMQPDTVLPLSGIVEILLGAALLFLPRHKATVDWVIGLFFVVFFSGNIVQLINQKDTFGLNAHLLRCISLPFQPLLIVLVLWNTGAWSTWRNKIKLKNQFHNILLL
ncbi:MAG: hypothetical protein SGI83_03215 [Bacteroidota bacterium]|nr:hypothetical protein [Bacteroidota bacterium]